ncbi:MAG: hypothetical protein QGG38_09245 [Nitrospinaceae bacterium]|nr:hypothetical protein [Nitrospinaceae bacterium]
MASCAGVCRVSGWLFQDRCTAVPGPLLQRRETGLTDDIQIKRLMRLTNHFADNVMA